MLLLLAASAASLILWAALDQRPPDDHDGWYTAHVMGMLTDVQGASRSEALARFARLVWSDSDHPPLASVSTWAALATAGPSRFVFRLSTLPFLLLLVAGTALAGWELLGRRWGLLAGAIVAGLPSVVNASRKSDYVFHASGLGAVGLAFALALVLRRPRRAEIWLAFGAFCGFRFSSHGLALVDVGATFLALALLEFARRRQGAPPAVQWRTGVLMVLLTAAVGAPLLGLPVPGHGAAEFALFKYWHFGSQYVVGGAGAATVDLNEVARAAGFAVRSLFRHHWMPVPALLLFVPGLLLAPWACLTRPTTADDERLRTGLRLLGVVLLVQVPVALLTLSHGAVLRDWIGLASVSTLLALGSLVRLGRLRGWELGVRAWAGVLLAHSVFAAFVPTVASALGPDPLVDYAAYRGPLLGPYATFDGRRREQTHHLASHSTHPSAVLTEVLSEAHGGPLPPGGTRPPFALLGGAGMQRDVEAARAAGCQAGQVGPGCCVWRWRSEPDLVTGSSWPFVFAGFAGLSDVRSEDGEARFVVVMLDLSGVDGQMPWEDPTTVRAWADDSCVAEAATQAAARLGVPATAVQLFEDPGRWLSAESDEPSTYVGRALLVDRGAGEVVEW